MDIKARGVKEGKARWEERDEGLFEKTNKKYLTVYHNKYTTQEPEI